ncbi:MAG: PASTA domain-containing protein [Oscillospiraceae bacterium]|nr:PASTA domain-containing protein [Oscillospiraceae bacterium]
MKCIKCGNKLNKNDLSCPQCGEPVSDGGDDGYVSASGGKTVLLIGIALFALIAAASAIFILPKLIGGDRPATETVGGEDGDETARPGVSDSAPETSADPVTQDAPVTVPDVVGLYYAAAAQILERVGLKAEAVRVDDDAEADTVLVQSVAAGRELPRGVLVRLQVSTGVSPVLPPPDGCAQKVIIAATGSSAALTLIEWDGRGWAELFTAQASVGANGVGSDYGEGKRISPEGIFDILFCYGLSAPDTRLRFKELAPGDVFVDDSASDYYNTIVNSSELPSGVSYENTYRQFQDDIYWTNIFFAYNGDGETPGFATPGQGSVYTICGINTSPRPTPGCIDITRADMTSLLALLDAAKSPVVVITRENG